MQNISLHIIASAGMATNANAKHILAYHCISRNGNEHGMSMSVSMSMIISLLLGGNGNKNQNLTFLSISLQLYSLNIVVSRAYEHGIHR